ncbi:hypothetical protein GI374_08465 [Paracoccus sp. S-4012]|uniref:hypothetical protein n=1 Tax=Paracoccus sp. S-4012 TaxID=2665648 RepID=UPI0012B1095A|nr:hypothetical protein [Paracoccus sp. S-4012]MRX50472.1 hypothetical protein [Paracoccus sp. S-4012]
MRDPLTRAWIWLLVLSAASTAIAIFLPGLAPDALRLTGVAILILAWMKARVILGTYLGLADYPAVGRGFGLALGLVMAVAFGLYLAA